MPVKVVGSVDVMGGEEGGGAEGVVVGVVDAVRSVSC